MKQIHIIYTHVLLIIGLFFGSMTSVYAQELRVIPEVVPSTISIGEQAQLKVRVVAPVGAKTSLALPKDTLVNGVEILSVEVIDSVSINDQLNEIVYGVVITSFDSATYQLKNVQALVNGQLVAANSAPSLMVNTVPVDLEHPDQFADIKGQWKPEFVWTDYLIYLLIPLVLGLLAAAIVLLIHYLKKKKKTVKVPVPEPMLDPYEEAITGMKSLKEEELWEKNQIKEYYTRMTDILRRYLWRVYGMETAEMTSSEILEAFNSMVGKDKMYVELKKILQTADLAKFASYRATSDENVSLMSAAVSFIEENKPQETPLEAAVERKEGEA